MNKTVTVNLGGSIFNIEEEAFHLLRNYLDRIQLNFTGDPAEKEIMSDIEVRIAELFQERLDEVRNVVVRMHVEEVIAIMGQPEDFHMGESSPDAGPAGRLSHEKRRIYRDADDAIIGGVCSGLSHYLGWDPLILRILFVIFGIISGGTAVIAYVIFWALVPAAKTTAEKLQMKGEPVNVESIRRMVNREARQASENISRWGQKGGKEVSRASQDFFRSLGVLIVKLAGLAMTIFGFSLLAGLVSLMLFAEINLFGSENLSMDELNRVVFGDTGSYWMVMLGAMLVMGIPAIALVYAGLRLLIGSTRRIRGLGWSLAALFVLGLILAGVSGIRMAREFASDAEFSETYVIDGSRTDTLHIEVAPDRIFTGRSHSDHDDFFELVHLTADSTYYGEPVHLHFEESTEPDYRIRITRSSNGPGQRRAGEMASAIRYRHFLSSDSLTLDPWFATPASDQFRGQEVEIFVLVPEGKFIHFGERIGLIYWDRNLAGQTVTLHESEWSQRVVPHTPRGPEAPQVPGAPEMPDQMRNDAHSWN